MVVVVVVVEVVVAVVVVMVIVAVITAMATIIVLAIMLVILRIWLGRAGFGALPIIRRGRFWQGRFDRQRSRWLLNAMMVLFSCVYMVMIAYRKLFRGAYA